MRVLGQDSRLCLLLCSNCFFLAQARLHPFAFVHMCMRVQQLVCLYRGPRASLCSAYKSYHNICTRGESRVYYARPTCERDGDSRATRVLCSRSFASFLSSSPILLALSTIFSFSLSLSLSVLPLSPSLPSLFRSLSNRVKLVSPLSISKRQIVSQSFLLDFNEIIRTRGSTSGVRPSFSTPPRRRFGHRKRAVPCWPAFKTSP